eukprot:g3787.t1
MLQRRTQSGAENETPCRLSEDDVRQFYNQSSRQWLITDEVLEAVSNDVQSIIECAQENDTLLFTTNAVVTPTRTLNLTKNLTLGSQGEPNLVDNESQISISEVTRFTCPESGQLITSRAPSFTLLNVAVEGCHSSSSIIELDADCEERPLERIRFRHVVIEGNILTGAARILNSISPMCFHLELDDVRIDRNLCAGDSCVFLSSRNTLNNIHLINNIRGNNSSPDLSIFSSPEGSRIIATNVTSTRNQMRSFYLSSCSFNIIDSNFNNNMWNLASVTKSNDVDGGILFSSSSTVSISSTIFEDNYALNGGVIYATDASNVLISQSNFTRNEAEYGGSLYVEDSSSVTISHSGFIEHKAETYGGVIYLENQASLTLLSVSLHNNSATTGGVIYLHGSSNGVVTDCTFTSNSATGNGGVFSIQRTSILNVNSSIFSSNKANYRGGVLSLHTFSSVTSFNCNFTKNKADISGAAIYMEEQSKVSLSSLEFHNNSAQYGGAIFVYTSGSGTISGSNFTYNTALINGGAINVDTESSLNLSYINFSSNKASNGGAVFLFDSKTLMESIRFISNNASIGGAFFSTNSTTNITDSTFEANHVEEFGGAVYLKESNATLQNTIMQSNEATKDCGGIYAAEVSHLDARNFIVQSNFAGNEGGGICVGNGSSILCYSCQISNNRADSGAGMFIHSNNSIPIVAQLQNSQFENNSAQSYGGGLVLNQQSNTSTNCNSSSVTCGHIILLNTNFKDNYANHTGAAILTSQAGGILIDCEYRGRRIESLLNQSDFRFLESLNPSPLCSKWTGNKLSNDEYEGIVGTFGKEIKLSIAPDDEEVKLIGDTKSGYVFENVTSGRRLPNIIITILDEFGMGPTPTFPNVFEARLSSPNGLFRGLYPANITDGSGNFSEVVGFAIPGNYTIKINSDNSNIQTLEAMVIVRECQVGEEPTNDGLTCQACDAFSYNFNPLEIGGCKECPSAATCKGRFIIPKKGYWHKSPCHNSLQKCLVEEACSYDNRNDTIMKFTNNYTSCSTNETDLEAYNQALCNEGYEGVLCGSCKHSYGLFATFQCLKCPNAVVSLLIIFGIVAYLLAAASLTIRGCLPYSVKPRDGASDSNESSIASEALHRDPQVNIEMVKMLVEGYVPKEYLERRQTNHSSEPPTPKSQQENEYELTRWRITEIFKIMINFLQTIAVAANVNVQWTKGMITLFESSEYFGALTTAAVSRPIDCIVPSSSSARLVMGIFCIFWGIMAIKNGTGWRYFLKRCILSTISVTYISYLGLTRMAVRGFYCIEVYDSYHYLKHSTNKFWAIDTSIMCYGKEHSGIMTISIVVLVIVAMCFPLISFFVLLKRKKSLGRRDIWIFETGGFLFRAFKENFPFWESVVMFRKACLSVIVVFSYPLGGDFQGVLASMLLLLSLHIHLTLKPYRKEFKSLNHFESCSLLMSGSTFTLSLFFVIGRCSDLVRTLLAIFIIVGNITFFMVLLLAFFHSTMVHTRVTLQCENITLPVPPTWWNVLKAYIRTRLVKYCQ